MKHGIIRGFHGNWSSGLATLTIEDDRGYLLPIPCDNAPTVRALSRLFPNTIGKAHTVNPEAFIGQEIFYALDDLGLCLAYISVDGEAPAEED